MPLTRSARPQLRVGVGWSRVSTLSWKRAAHELPIVLGAFTSRRPIRNLYAWGADLHGIITPADLR